LTGINHGCTNSSTSKCKQTEVKAVPRERAAAQPAASTVHAGRRRPTPGPRAPLGGGAAIGPGAAQSGGVALRWGTALGYGVALTAATWALAATSPDLAELTSAATDPARAAAEAGVDRTVVVLLALSAWACLAWLLLSTAVSVLAHLPGRLGRLAGVVADHVAPALVRQAVGAVLGVSALVGVIAPTAASAAAPVPVVPPAAAESGAALAVGPAPTVDRPGLGARAASRVSAQPGPGRLPGVDWPAGRAHDSGAARPPAPAVHAAPGLVTSAPARAGTGPEPVVVHRGDTLWSIAARHLGPGATPVDVARAWPVWHEANRHVIGPDPDRLLPGQRLQPPA
jgi:hypothetical protein